MKLSEKRMTKSLHVAIAEFSTNFDDYRLIVTENAYNR